MGTHQVIESLFILKQGTGMLKVFTRNTAISALIVEA